MRIFVAGATGTLGRPVVRQLHARGHELIGLTRSPERAHALNASGVRGVVGDALDGRVMNALVTEAKPDRVVHLLTALPPGGPQRKSQLKATNELRTKGTAHLIEASIKAGANRLVAESFVGIYGTTSGDRRVSADEPLPPVPSGTFAETIEALRVMEEKLLSARLSGLLTTVALRIGFLYGSEVPATQEMVRQARAGRLFVPRDLPGIAAFVHVEDAARAIVAAVEAPDPSPVYNVVDDRPMPLAAFSEEFTTALGARPARHVPQWLLRIAAPVMADLLSWRLVLSNDRLKSELGWAPQYPTVHDGLTEVREALAQAA